MKCRIVSNKELFETNRFDGSFHNAEMNVYDTVIKKHSSHALKYFCDDIFTSGRNKRVYTLEEYGYPFLSNSDVSTYNPFMACKYSSKKIGNDEKAFLKEGMIVTGRVGAIGQTSYVPYFWEKEKAQGSDNIIRISVKQEYKRGFIYAYLSSKMGNMALWKLATGGVQPFITDIMVGGIAIPDFPDVLSAKINSLIIESSQLRGSAFEKLKISQKELQQCANLPELEPEYYDFYGLPSDGRSVSTFVRRKSDLSLSINAFNYSERIRILEDKIRECCKTVPLHEVIEDGHFFSTGSFPRVEVSKDFGIMLINQSDIFDSIIKGKYISKRGVKTDNLVDYGEVLIAGVGTLGENEIFCRTIFANEDLQGQLVSGEFIRMKANETVPAGYLYSWLSSGYGFRLIRSTQTGTKQCRPIQKMLLNKPIPIIDKTSMEKIDLMVRDAHTLLYQSNQKERQAIQMVEEEIEKWNN